MIRFLLMLFLHFCFSFLEYIYIYIYIFFLVSVDWVVLVQHSPFWFKIRARGEPVATVLVLKVEYHGVSSLSYIPHVPVPVFGRTRMFPCVVSTFFFVCGLFCMWYMCFHSHVHSKTLQPSSHYHHHRQHHHMLR